MKLFKNASKISPQRREGAKFRRDSFSYKKSAKSKLSGPLRLSAFAVKKIAS